MPSISPQGYTLGGDPKNINPFWGEDEITNWSIEADATVDSSSDNPSVNVETDTDTTTKTKTFTFEFSGLKGEPGSPGEPGQPGQPGSPGAAGNGIQSITKTSSVGLVDTYTITFTDGTSTTFDITNGADGNPGTPGSSGVGIRSIVKTSTSGLVDTYTITLTNGATSTFTVTNGATGSPGQAGDTPVITITASQNGTPITVTKTGTDAAPNFDFALTGGGGGASGPVVWIPTGSDEAPATPNRYYQVDTIQAASHAGVTITAPYTFNDEYGSGDDITFNVTINLDSAITDGEDIWYGCNITPNVSSGGQDDSNAPTISITVNSVTIDNPNVTYSGTDFEDMSTEFLNGNIVVTYPDSISIEYGGESYTADYSGDTQHDDVPSYNEYVGTYQYTEELTWYSLGIAQS